MSHHSEVPPLGEKPRTATFAFKSAAEDGAAGDKGAKNKHVSTAARTRAPMLALPNTALRHTRCGYACSCAAPADSRHRFRSRPLPLNVMQADEFAEFVARADKVNGLSEAAVADLRLE